MKKYLLLTAATAAVVSWILLMPMGQSFGATDVTVRKAAVARAATTVDCTGTLQSAAQQTIVYGYPVMAEKVYVRAGDTVTKGQTLLQVNRTETAAAFATITAAQSASSIAADDGSSSSSDTSGSSSSADDAAIQQYLSGQGGDIDSLVSEYYASSSSSSADGGGTDSSTSDASSSDASASDTAGSVAAAADSAALSMDVPETICADISGVVTKVNATAGNFTQSTVPLVVISDSSHMQVKSQVDESQISGVKVGQKVHVTGDAFSGTYDGVVSQIAPTARTVITGTTSSKTVVDVTIDLTSTDSQLKAGMSASTSILISNQDEISLPYEAIRQDSSNRLYVMVVRDGKAYRQDITTGTEHTDDIAIRSGVKSGDMVIINPPQSLHSGMPVRSTSTG